jgi:hypothetical protein
MVYFHTKIPFGHSLGGPAMEIVGKLFGHWEYLKA